MYQYRCQVPKSRSINLPYVSWHHFHGSENLSAQRGAGVYVEESRECQRVRYNGLPFDSTAVEERASTYEGKDLGLE